MVYSFLYEFGSLDWDRGCHVPLVCHLGGFLMHKLRAQDLLLFSDASPDAEYVSYHKNLKIHFMGGNDFLIGSDQR